MPDTVRMGRPARLAYGVGSVGAGIYSTVPGILLLYFMTQVLEVPVGLAALALLVPKLAIIVIDPLIGNLSDGWRSRWGRRRPFLVVGALSSGGFFFLLFNAPSLGSPALTTLGVGIAYLLASVSFSVFAVPYIAMAAELTRPGPEQSALIAWRMFFVFVGVLLGMAVGPLLVDVFGPRTNGYAAMAAILAALSTVLMLITAVFTPAPATPAERQSQTGLLSAIRHALSSALYRRALITYGIAILALGAATAGAPYFVTFALGRDESSLARLLFGQILLSLAVMLPWARAVARFGARRALTAACVFTGLAQVALFFLEPTAGFASFVMVYAIAGIGVGGVQVAAFSWLAELSIRRVGDDGDGRESTLAGIWTATEKLGLALGPALTAVVLAIAGFDSGADVSLQPEGAVSATQLTVSLFPAALLFIAAAVTRTPTRKSATTARPSTAPARTLLPPDAVD